MMFSFGGPEKNLSALAVVTVTLMGCASLDPRKPFASEEEVRSERLQFASGVPATVAADSVPGDVHFRVYRVPAGQRGQRRLDRCVLQHGFGVEQTLLDFKTLTYDLFVSTYFGDDTIHALLDSVCESVYVTVQESNTTSILEMTQRTEVLLRDIACPITKGKQLRCALVGHSKGGAVAFSIARRCMQERSLLGKEGCGRLLEVYSATGVIQGAMGSFIAYGAALTRNSEHAALFTKVLGFGANLVWKVYADFKPGKNNPIWLDLSPLAPMEDGVPLFLANNVILKKEGWLKADFAASAVSFTFKGKGDEKLFGCGDEKRAESNRLNYHGCRVFGSSAALLHSDKLRPSFFAGLEAMKADDRLYRSNNKSPRFLDEVTWQRYQQSDGLADLRLAIGSCQAGLRVPGAARAVRSCTVFEDLNHLATAGGGPKAIADLLRQLGQ